MAKLSKKISNLLEEVRQAILKEAKRGWYDMSDNLFDQSLYAKLANITAFEKSQLLEELHKDGFRVANNYISISWQNINWEPELFSMVCKKAANNVLETCYHRTIKGWKTAIVKAKKDHKNIAKISGRNYSYEKLDGPRVEKVKEELAKLGCEIVGVGDGMYNWQVTWKEEKNETNSNI